MGIAELDGMSSGDDGSDISVTVALLNEAEKRKSSCTEELKWRHSVSIQSRNISTIFSCVSLCLRRGGPAFCHQAALLLLPPIIARIGQLVVCSQVICKGQHIERYNADRSNNTQIGTRRVLDYIR